jgi:hypothetical protein
MSDVNGHIRFRTLRHDDTVELLRYFDDLSAESRGRFAPRSPRFEILSE